MAGVLSNKCFFDSLALLCSRFSAHLIVWSKKNFAGFQCPTSCLTRHVVGLNICCSHILWYVSSCNNKNDMDSRQIMEAGISFLTEGSGYFSWPLVGASSWQLLVVKHCPWRFMITPDNEAVAGHVTWSNYQSGQLTQSAVIFPHLTR